MPKKSKRRRANGDGSVFYRPSKERWYAQVAVRDKSGKARYVSKSARSRPEAVQLLVEMQANRAPAQNERQQCTILLGEYLDRWLKRNPEGFAETTLYGYSLACKNHIKPHLEGYRLDEITDDVVMEWLDDLAEANTGATTKVRCFSTLSSAMNQAVTDKLIPKNPLHGVRRPAEPETDIQPFSEDEVRRILNSRESHRMYAAFLLPFICGLRQGELFGLQWRDIDFSNRTIKIDRQACEVKGRIYVRPPKWGSYRTVSMTQAVHDALLFRRELTLKTGVDWVFTTKDENVMKRTNFSAKYWNPLLKQLGIRHRGLHHARHTCITHMLNRGVPVHVVSRIAGHKKPSTTLNIYAHLMHDDSRLAAEAMASFANGNVPATFRGTKIALREA